MDVEKRKRLRVELLREAATGIMGQPWHWFGYHFQRLPPHPFARSFIDAAVECEGHIPGLGRDLIRDLGAIGGIDHHEPHYDQLMQKLAEILVLRQLVGLPWPAGTTFEHEPALTLQGKRPEIKAQTPDHTYLFEVKTPSLTSHARNRAENNLQAPARMFQREMLDRLAGEGGLTLPRDNPVKDFLIDADAKFAPFKAAGAATSLLVIVWDDHIYEPITVLTQEQCGLLTPNSYHVDANGAPIGFPNIDGVVLIRHLMYFRNAAGDVPLVERRHAFDFGDEGALPNVFVPVPGGASIPEFIRDGLRARPLDDPFLQRAAEYRPVEMVFWLDLNNPDPR
jgi:hypothetical protein